MNTIILESIDRIESPLKKKQRRGIDDARRRTLRRYKEEYLKATHKELYNWFIDKFHLIIS